MTYKRQKGKSRQRRYVSGYTKDDGTRVKGHYRSKSASRRYRSVRKG